MINQKRGMSAWIWILIFLILVAIGIAVYFWLTEDSYPVANYGGSIPQPPALPN